MSNNTYTLKLSCDDGVGIVAAVSGFIASQNGWILESNDFADPISKKFFMRQVIDAKSLNYGIEILRQAFTPLAQKFNMEWEITDSEKRKRVVILVSKQSHCLYDLLARFAANELNIEIPCIISNHEDLRGLCEFHGIKYHYIPVTKYNKLEAYGKIADIFDDVQGDVMVLARYMQVLSPEICERFKGKIINIHHSFLPSFVGAKPYSQAHAKGVKLVGATCHYVTADLDQGPIIEQDVIRVDHSDGPEDLALYGKDVEKAVLARGLRYHLEDRVIINQNRTIILQ